MTDLVLRRTSRLRVGARQENEMDAKELVGKLRWLGHDSFRLDGPPVIYFDPCELKGQLPKGDLVLVSHEHHDHCSPDDVKR